MFTNTKPPKIKEGYLLSNQIGQWYVYHTGLFDLLKESDEADTKQEKTKTKGVIDTLLPSVPGGQKALDEANPSVVCQNNPENSYYKGLKCRVSCKTVPAYLCFKEAFDDCCSLRPLVQAATLMLENGGELTESNSKAAEGSNSKAAGKQDPSKADHDNIFLAAAQNLESKIISLKFATRVRLKALVLPAAPE